MSVIQNIRDKYARLMVILIAVSLLGFILMDAFSSRSNLFSGNSTTVGKINGHKIDIKDFEERVKQQEDMQKAQGNDMGEAGRQNLIQGIWNQEITENLLNDQSEKLGLQVSTKEMNDYLFGANPPQDLRQRFTDSTGNYNAALALQQIRQITNSKRPEDAATREQVANYIESLRKQRAYEKYASLLNNTIYMPKWMVEKQTADNALVARTSYVAVPYASISDSAVKVSDAEISQYVNNHRNDFEQKEESRNISFVLFPTLPTARDTAATRDELAKARPGFDTTTQYAKFLALNSSTMQYFDGLVSKKQMQQPNKDSILAAGVGNTYGPYVDRDQKGNSFLVLSRIVEAHAIPDTVKVRHILISVARVDPQSGQQVPGREDAAGKTLADSILKAINGGASFDSMVTKYSDDPGSKQKGGVYDSIGFGRMVPQFNDYIFTHSPGQRDVVKTDFGYHIIEVLATRGGSDMAYKIAYLARPIVAGNETENEANTTASQFAADSRSLESFNENFDKSLRGKGLNKQSAELHEMDFNIPGAGSSRPLVKDVFKASKGDVLPVQRVANGYIVAAVTAVNTAGVQSAAQARPVVEPVLRNKKKAEQIKKNIGTVSTLEAVAQKTNQTVATADSLHFNGNNAQLGFEYKVIGASFNPANKGKVVTEPIEGQAAVYVIRVDNVSAAASNAAGIDQQRALLTQDARQRAAQSDPMEALRKAASIKDYRTKFY